MMESTVRYLGIEVDDAIEIFEKIDISGRRNYSGSRPEGRSNSAADLRVANFR